MKTLISILLFSAALFAQQPVQVFIFAGQSNMQGYGNRGQLAPVPTWAQNAANGWTGAPAASSDTGIQYPHPTLANSPGLYAQNWWVAPFYPATFGAYSGQAVMPNGTLQEVGSFGPELSFIAKWQADHPGQKWAALKVGIGGTSVNDWLPGGSINPQWHGMITAAKVQFAALGLVPNWAGMLWMQGENGASGTYNIGQPPYYADQVRQLLVDIRAETSLTMPVVVGRMGNHMLLPNILTPMVHPSVTMQMLLDANNFRRSQQELVGGDPGNTWVNTDDLPVLQVGDPQYWYHHTSAGYLAMGERFYAGFSTAVPPPTPLGTSYACSVLLNGQAIAPETTSLSFNGTRPVLSVSGSSVDRFTPWYFSCVGAQQ